MSGREALSLRRRATGTRWPHGRPVRGRVGSPRPARRRRGRAARPRRRVRLGRRTAVGRRGARRSCEALGCHPLVLEALPAAQPRADRARLQRPLLRDHAQRRCWGRDGHVHLLELDQIIGDRFLVTVHGPLNPVVDPTEALVETAAVLRPDRGGPVPPRRRRPSCPTRSPRRSPGGSAPWSAPVAEQAPRARAAGDGVAADRAGGAAGADVPDPARADHGPDDGRADATTSTPGSARSTGSSPSRRGCWPATWPTSSTGCGRSRTARRSSCSA